MTYGLGREDPSGIWGRWFCASCNTRTGLWDEEYARWMADPLVALHDPRNTGDRFLARMRDADPGAFVRCVWSWMFAIGDDLRGRYEAVASAVLTGKPAEPPEDLRLLLAVTRDLQFGQLGVSFAIAVTAPPFVACLVKREFAWQCRGFLDIGPWLHDCAGVRRAIQVELPIVHTFDEDDLPPVGEPVLDS